MNPADKTSQSPSHQKPIQINTYPQLIERLAEKREAVLYTHLTQHVHLVDFNPSHLVLRLSDQAPKDIILLLKNFLFSETGQSWKITISQEKGIPTYAEQQEIDKQQKLSELSKDPLVQLILDTFPGAMVEQIET